METKSSSSLDDEDGMDFEDLLEPPILSLEPTATDFDEERLPNTVHVNDDIKSKTWSEMLTDFVTVGNVDSDEELAGVKDGATRTESAKLDDEATRAESADLEDEATRTDSENLDDEATRIGSVDLEDDATITSSANLDDEATITSSANLDDVLTRTDAVNLEDDEAIRTEVEYLNDDATRTDLANLDDESTKIESATLEDEAKRTDSANLDDEATRTESVNLDDEATRTESVNLDDEATRTESVNLDDDSTRTESANLEDEATRIDLTNLEDEATRIDLTNLEDEAPRTDSADLDVEVTRKVSADLEDEATRTDATNLDDEATRTESANLDGEATRIDSTNLVDEATRTVSSDLDNVERHKVGDADMQDQTDIDVKPLFNHSGCVNVKTEPNDVEDYTGWPVMHEKHTPTYIESDKRESAELGEKNKLRDCFVSLCNFKVRATKDGRMRCLKCNSSFKKADTIKKHIYCRDRFSISSSKADNVQSDGKVRKECKEPNKINTTLHNDKGQVCEPNHKVQIKPVPNDKVQIKPVPNDKVQIKPVPNDKVQIKPEPYWNERCEPTAEEPYEEPAVIAGPFQNVQMTQPASFHIKWRRRKKYKDLGPHKCSLCQQMFDKRQQLRDHVASLHVEMDFLLDSEPDDNIIELDEEEPLRGRRVKKETFTSQPLAETRPSKKLIMSKSSDQTSGGHGLPSVVARKTYGRCKEEKPQHELIVKESEKMNEKPAIVLKKCGVVNCFINDCKESHYSEKSFRCHIVGRHAEMNEKTFSALLDAIPASFWRRKDDKRYQDIIEIDAEEMHDAKEKAIDRVGDTPSEPTSSNKKRKRTKEGDQLSCLFKNCSKTFTLEQDLVTHIKKEIESQNRKIEAAEVLDDIVRPEDLLTYLSDCNIGEPIVLYVCTTCGQIFFDCKLVKLHQQTTHGCTCNSKMEIWRQEASDKIQYLVNHVNKKNKKAHQSDQTGTNCMDETDIPDGSGMNDKLGSNKILKYIWTRDQCCECESTPSVKCGPVASLKIKMISPDPDDPGAKTETYPAPESTALNCNTPSRSAKPDVYPEKSEMKQPLSVPNDKIAKTLTHWTSYNWQKWVKKEKEETDKGLVQQDIKSDKNLGSSKKSAQASGIQNPGTFKCCFATCRKVYCCDKSLQQHIQKKHLLSEFKRTFKKRHLP